MGGRLSSFEIDGFKFDYGPSYWMPDVFEDFFNDFNKKVSDYYELKRLNPSYKFYFEKNNNTIPSKFSDIKNEYDKIENNSSVKLDQFIKRGEKKYKISMDGFIDLPNLSFKEYFSFDVLKHFFSLDFFISLRKHIKKYFNNSKMIQMLEFPSMFLGGTPSNTPGLYSLMNYADLKVALGTQWVE